MFNIEYSSIEEATTTINLYHESKVNEFLQKEENLRPVFYLLEKLFSFDFESKISHNNELFLNNYLVSRVESYDGNYKSEVTYSFYFLGESRRRRRKRRADKDLCFRFVMNYKNRYELCRKFNSFINLKKVFLLQEALDEISCLIKEKTSQLKYVTDKRNAKNELLL